MDTQVVNQDELEDAIEAIGPITDMDTFQSYLDRLEPLKDIYQDELEAASADADCRTANFELLSEMLEELSLDIYGSPFGDLN